MKVGYCVPITPHMASYRLRVAIPAPLIDYPYEIGTYGELTFFYKHFESDLDLARCCHGPFVYDVVNDHFTGKLAEHYLTMCDNAAQVTCASESMAATIKLHTGRTATVIDDPWENEESPPACDGRALLWFGHSANISSLIAEIEKLGSTDATLMICTNYPHQHMIKWTPESERKWLKECSAVLVTGNNAGASANRIVKALRAGRFVITPGGVPAWEALKDYIWIGDVRDGIEWAFSHRKEACAKIAAGQTYVKERYSPQRIGQQWRALFCSTWEQATNARKVG